MAGSFFDQNPAPRQNRFAGAGQAGLNALRIGGQTSAGAGANLGPIGAIATAIVAGKTIEQKNPNSIVGRGLLSGLGPSFNQIRADPKLGALTLAGLPFLGGAVRNDKAANASPEWAFLFGG